jgi:hypothetical protein
MAMFFTVVQKITLLGLMLPLTNPQVRTPRPGSTRLGGAVEGAHAILPMVANNASRTSSPYESTGGRCPKNTSLATPRYYR